MTSTPHMAARLARLGDEQVMHVSMAARALAAAGHTIYPFHIGDVNLGAAPNVIEAMHQAVRDGHAGYVSPQGIQPLREALAEDVGALRGLRYQPSEVAVVPGGKPVITRFVQALMEPGDEVLYPSPGFPIYESQIEYYGGVAVPYRFVEQGGRLVIDLEHLKAHITPKTRLLMFNNCHNPTAAESSADEIEQLAEIVLEHDLWVLSDDAYTEVRYSGRTNHLVSIPGLQERTVILYTFSKRHGMTGWRLGAAIGPQPVIDAIAKINLNDESCTNEFVQWGGVEAMRGAGSAAHAAGLVNTLRARRDAGFAVLSQIPGVQVSLPECAFYFYPDVTDAAQAKGFRSVNDFATAAMRETGVSFATRNHFNRVDPAETRLHIRMSYSGIDVAQIEAGLARFKTWIEGG